MSLFSKLAHYARGAAAQRSLNLRGLPLIPKSLWRDSAYNREGFNQFLLWIRQLGLPNVACVVDVGANHGDFSLAAGALYPDARILLVEPLPALSAELQRRCARRAGKWSLVPCALGAETGTATLHIDPRLDAVGSLVGFSDEYLKFNKEARPSQTLQCSVRTLDEVCAEQGIDSIDLLKIDVEGFELETLRGGQRMLSRTRAIIIEVSLVRRVAKRNALVVILEILTDVGFHVVQLYSSSGSSEAPWLPLEYNVLARRD